jgi:DNA-binding response OmpR family regulator
MQRLRMKILLAEDDANISVIARLVLEKLGGHEVVVRDNGQDALDTALREPFDLILLDGMMPGKTGLQVAAGLRDAGIFSTPIIFLSAKTDTRDVELFLEHGHGYIAKPFDPQSLCQSIEQLLTNPGRKIA